MSKDAPDKFLTKSKNNKKIKNENSLNNIGVGSEEEAKNINPDLKIRG